jgi:hypothetical protein
VDGRRGTSGLGHHPGNSDHRFDPHRTHRGAGIYEIGSVAGDGVSLFSSEAQHSYGFGLRATLERTAPFRVDFGFSKDGMNVTARFGLSF